MTCVFDVLSAFDIGVVLIEFVTVFVTIEVLMSLVLVEEVFVMIGVAVVLVSDAVFLLSLCLVVLQEMNMESKLAYLHVTLLNVS